MKAKFGKVYLVGAGPGDLGLITQKGMALIRSADVIFYDNLVNPLFLNYASSRCKKVYVGKRGEGNSTDQKAIEDQLVEAAGNHACVLRLKGGDPFIFGRGGEEAQRLSQEKIEFEIVPGVSSAIAAPAYAGIPLTHRNLTSAVVFITGHFQEKNAQAPLDWEALSKIGTLVFLMSVKTLDANMKNLMKAGRDPQTPAAFIRWGTYPQQETHVSDIAHIAEEVEAKKLMPPAIVVVGEVVKLRDEIAWFEKKPLFGKKILLTRARIQASEASKILQDWGAEVWELPCIEVVPPADGKELDESIQKVGTYDWLVFTSVNAVHSFFTRFKDLKQDIRKLFKIKIAAVGPMTARALNNLHLQVDKIPEEFQAERLAQSFTEDEVKGKRILFPRAKEGKEELIQILEQKGATIDLVTAYQIQTPPLDAAMLEKLLKQKPDCIAFASSSAVRHLIQMLPTDLLKELRKIPSICIGPQTFQEAQALGFEKAELSTNSSLPGLLQTTLQKLTSY